MSTTIVDVSPAVEKSVDPCNLHRPNTVMANGGSSQRDLTQGDIGKQLLFLAIPMFLGISSMIVASMIDTIYIGILGAAELAALSYTFPLIMGLSSISMGVGMGASSLISRAFGVGDSDSVKVLATHAMLLTFVFVAALAAAGYLYIGELFTLMGAQPEILPLVLDYMSIWLVGLPLFAIPMVGSTIARAVGNARVPGYAMVAGSAFQVAISPLLIFGLLGFPDWGFAGSAWAFVFSGVVRLLIMSYVILFQERLIVWEIPRLRQVIRSWNSILYIGVPSMLSSLIGPVTLAIILRLLSAHGADVVAGFGIASRVDMLATMVIMSLSSSIAPFVGQNWGARKIERIHSGLRISYTFCLVWGLVCALILGPFGGNIIFLINETPGVVDSAGLFLMIVPISFGFLGVGSMAGSMLVALGKPIPNLIMSIMRMVVVYLPMAVVGDMYWGYLGIFVATSLANVIMGLVAFVWGRSILTREISRLGPLAFETSETALARTTLKTG